MPGNKTDINNNGPFSTDMIGMNYNYPEADYATRYNIMKAHEKWFVAQMLGEKAWFIQSELNYYKNINDYYKNLNRLGMFYEQLDYSKAMPFLLMLPQSITNYGL
jgi:hypothetical protein